MYIMAEYPNDSVNVMALSESEITNKIRLAASKLGAKIFRNNVGLIKDAKGRIHRFGLCKGSSDLIGYVPIEITQDMVGKKIAVFSAIEAKAAKGKASDDQKNFIRVILENGGLAGIARCDEDAEKILRSRKFPSAD